MLNDYGEKSFRHDLGCRLFVGDACEEGSVDSDIAGINGEANPNDGDANCFDYENFG